MTTGDPQVLYRYRHLQGEHREWTKRILIDSVLYFAKPSTLNDPFDCRVHFRPSVSRKELRRKHSVLVSKHVPQLNRAQRRAKVAADFKSTDPGALLSYMTRQLQGKVDGTGILSLSATGSNILLWSHYAAGHKGLCLKFAATKHTPFFGCAQQVDYTPSYPAVDLLSDSPEQQFKLFLLTKAIDWKYEEEWRIIDHDGGPGNKVFPEESLIGVTFGARMEPDDREAVIEWLEARNDTVQLYQASVAPDSFSLEIEPFRP